MKIFSPSFSLGFGLLAVTLVGVGCTSSSGSADRDSGEPGVDAGSDPGVDAGVADAGPPIHVVGTVYAQDAPARTDGGVDFPDGGMPPTGAPVTADGRVVGATVTFFDLDGGALDTTTTDDHGGYELDVPARVLGFLHAAPVEGYIGGLRAERTHGSDYTAWDIVLQRHEGIEVAAEQAGVVNDPSLGWMGFGFSIVSREQGGEGADLPADVEHGPAFTFVPFDVIVTDRLPAVCLPDGSTAPGAYDGMPCTTLDRSNWIMYPNVELGFVRPELVDPPTGHCELRYDVDRWLVIADTSTKVLVDCVP